MIWANNSFHFFKDFDDDIIRLKFDGVYMKQKKALCLIFLFLMF